MGPQAPPVPRITPQQKTMAWIWTGSKRRSYYKRYGGYYRRGYRRNTKYYRQASQPVEDIEPGVKRVVADPVSETRLTRMYGKRTVSSIVKLSYNFEFEFQFAQLEPVGVYNRALRFVLNEVPGFTDYLGVFSEYRIIRGELYIPTPQSSTGVSSMSNYLIVSSQPFALTAAPVSDNPTENEWVPNQVETSLRQARWQRIVYPDTTTTGVRVGFRPYTMVATDGPINSTVQYQRIWHGYNWTPFTWATESNPITYFGPYVLGQGTVLDDQGTWNPHPTVVLYCQFRGQK